jgi:4-amino-4-deoxy-L-arabinose transferase-like glycosyltransferase
LLTAGDALGSDVFASQPPLFYDLLRLLGLLLPDSVDGLRVGMTVISLASLVVAYALGSTYTGRAGGLGAALVLAVTPVVAHTAPLVEAEQPALLLVLVALLAAARTFGVEYARPRGAYLAGAALSAAVLVKLLAVTAVVPLVAIALAQRATRRQLVSTLVGGAAVVLATALLHLGAIPELVEEAVGFHLDARNTAFGNDDDLARMKGFLHLRAPATYLLVAGALAGLLPVNRRLWPLWSFTAAALAFTLLMQPLFDHHLVLPGTAAAVPAGAALGGAVTVLPRRAALAAAACMALLGAAGVAQLHREPKDTGESSETKAAATALRAGTQPGDRVVADEPTVVLLADRLVPGELVDTSAVRFATGSLTRADVLRAARAPGVGGAVSGRMFLAQPGLTRQLGVQFPVQRRVGEITVSLPSASSR